MLFNGTTYVPDKEYGKVTHYEKMQGVYNVKADDMYSNHRALNVKGMTIQNGASHLKLDATCQNTASAVTFGTPCMK